MLEEIKGEQKKIREDRKRKNRKSREVIQGYDRRLIVRFVQHTH